MVLIHREDSTVKITKTILHINSSAYKIKKAPRINLVPFQKFLNLSADTIDAD